MQKNQDNSSDKSTNNANNWCQKSGDSSNADPFKEPPTGPPIIVSPGAFADKDYAGLDIAVNQTVRIVTSVTASTGVGTITNNPGGKSAYCAQQALKGAAKDAIGYDLVSKAADIGANGLVDYVNHTGPFGSSAADASKSLASAATTVSILDHAASFVQNSASAQGLIRTAVRATGSPISLRRVSNLASGLGKFAAWAGVAITADTAWNAYQACMND